MELGSEGPHRHTAVEEVYYVIKGEGRLPLQPRYEGFSGAEKRADNQPLELLIVGIAREKGRID